MYWSSVVSNVLYRIDNTGHDNFFLDIVHCWIDYLPPSCAPSNTTFFQFLQHLVARETTVASNQIGEVWILPSALGLHSSCKNLKKCRRKSVMTSQVKWLSSVQQKFCSGKDCHVNKAEVTCYDSSCTAIQNGQPIRMCRDCHSKQHREIDDHRHIFQGTSHPLQWCMHIELTWQFFFSYPPLFLFLPSSLSFPLSSLSLPSPSIPFSFFLSSHFSHPSVFISWSSWPLDLRLPSM